jgi:hypothetical protein
MRLLKVQENAYWHLTGARLVATSSHTFRLHHEHCRLGQLFELTGRLARVIAIMSYARIDEKIKNKGE